MRALREIEGKYSQPVSLIAIHDDSRWEVLRHDLSLSPNTRRVLFPISEPPQSISSNPNILRDHLNLPGYAKILLYFGVVRPERGEIARCVDHLPKNGCVVFHGPCSESTERQILSLSQTKRVFISRQPVAAGERALLVASADAGLAIYGEQSSNDQLTGFSSEKVALYLMCGKPIIAMRNRSYAHIESSRAGVLVNSIDEIPNAVSIIERHSNEFSLAAIDLFERCYSTETNVRRLVRAAQCAGASTYQP
jgi:hypothetical protein